MSSSATSRSSCSARARKSGRSQYGHAQFQQFSTLANKVRTVAQAANRIVEKFAVLAVQPEPGKSPDSYAIATPVVQAISRCTICSPRFFEKQGTQAACQVEQDLQLVAQFITSALKQEPSIFKATGREKIKAAASLARQLSSELRQQQLPEPGTLQAFVTALAPNSVQPIDLVVSTQVHITGVGPIEAILEALSKDRSFQTSMMVGQMRQTQRASEESTPQNILIPVLIKGSQRETMARVSITIDPSLFGGMEQTLTNVAEFLRDSVGTVEAGQFEQLAETELFGWKNTPTEGITVTIVTDQPVTHDSEAKELVRETGKVLERMLKLERAFDKVTGTRTFAGQHA